MATIRHEFYETDEKVTISVFDRGADPEQVNVTFEPRRLTYVHGEKNLTLEPLKGQIDTENCRFTVGKVKVEIQLVKLAPGRWGALVGDMPDTLATPLDIPSSTPSTSARKSQKNWDGITTDILSNDKEKTTDEDPNVGGDATVNSFFQKIFGDADDDTKKAMMKSYQESGGTTLSTDWSSVGKEKVSVKPPTGSEWKKWGA